MPRIFSLLTIGCLVFSLCTEGHVFAATITPTGQKATISIAPHTGSFLENSTFEVPVFINTHGDSINAIELHINFDAQKLNIIKPSGGQSIITLWAEPPSYSNTHGTVKIVGTIPNGIITESGLITTLTFKAITPGKTQVSVSNASRVLANDGYGTEVALNVDRGSYDILQKPPEDIKVFSETHPFSDKWYNNNNPILSWEKDPGISDFSFVLDNKPFTVPDNTPDSTETATSYQNLPDGISYFHIKGRKKNVWGGTTNFAVRIDTAPPAAFKPSTDIVVSNDPKNPNKVLVSYFTTDGMSGIDHYEIGTIEKKASADASPILVQAESPFQLPIAVTSEARVLVRAFDRAGNVQDASIDVNAPVIIPNVIKNNLVTILAVALIIILLMVLIHYLISHRVLRHFRRALEVVHQEEAREQTFAENYSQYVQPPPPPQPPQIQPVPQMGFQPQTEPVKLPVQSELAPPENTYVPGSDSALNR
jgi:hypothetical protein